MSARLSPTLHIMVKAAEKAAKSLLRDFGELENLQVSVKAPGDFVSKADKRAEEIIHEELSSARPDYGFLMEEQGEVSGKDPYYRWIIDPLDGTNNFLRGIPHWAISIALEHKGEIIAGVIFDPVKNDMFRAEKNGSAFCNRRRLRVSGRSAMVDCTFAHGTARRTPTSIQKFQTEVGNVLTACRNMRRMGAAALDMAYVADGRLDGYWERGVKAWDIAAGIIIVREAGGYAQDLDDRKKNPLTSGNVIAANSEVFPSFQKLILNANSG